MQDFRTHSVLAHIVEQCAQMKQLLNGIGFAEDYIFALSDIIFHDKA